MAGEKGSSNNNIIDSNNRLIAETPKNNERWNEYMQDLLVERTQLLL